MFPKRKNQLICLVFGTFWVLLNAQENTTEISITSTTDFTTEQNSQSETNETEIIISETPNLRNMVTTCSTPNGDTGYCLPINDCPKLMKQLANENARTFLRESKCGPKKEKNPLNPSVCCGKYNNYKERTCGYQNVTIRGRIVGGRQATLGEFPWLAMLFHKNENGVKTFGCSGFLIAPRFVLTAAHCLKSENMGFLGPIYEAHLGEHNTKTKVDCNSKNTTCTDKVQVIKVHKTIAHPSYNISSRHHHNDIGLIYLKKGAKYSRYVFPICLLENVDFEPFEYWLSGWGTTEHERLSDVKMKVSVPPFSHSNCTKLYEKVRVKVTDKQLCAGGKKNKDSCSGDSGGPLMLVIDGTHWYAAGVVSYGLGCGRDGWPAIYTNITSYSQWIKNTMTELKSDKSKPGNTKQ